MKHFLDTSVLRPIISSSKATKKYYVENLSGSIYYSSYIHMEFIRGFLIPCMNFYSLNLNPNIENISDAIHFWTNNFKTRELKAVLSLIGNLLTYRNIDLNNFRDKERGFRYIGDYIKRIYFQVPLKFKNIGIDNHLCKRLDTILDINSTDDNESFLSFITSFDDESNYKECRLRVFLKNNEGDINNIIEQKDKMIQGSNRQGFQKIIQSYTGKLPDEFNCRDCSKIGDLIIGLISPTNMRLEHTDNSFDYIMEILNKNHFKHPSEVKIISGKANN